MTVTGLAAVLTWSAAGARAQTAAEPEKETKPKWESSASLGFTLTDGNSDTLLLTGNIKTQKKMPRDEIAFGVDGAYGENEGEKNNETLHGFGQYNRLFTDRFFGYLRADALHDGIADIDYRVALSPGAGYYFVKEKKVTLAGEVGPGVIFERKGGESDTYMTIRFAERFEWKITEKSRLWQSVEYLPQVDDFANYIINAEIGIETAITPKIWLQTYVQDNYVSQPAPGRESNDVKLVTGISYKF